MWRCVFFAFFMILTLSFSEALATDIETPVFEPLPEELVADFRNNITYHPADTTPGFFQSLWQRILSFLAPGIRDGFYSTLYQVLSIGMVVSVIIYMIFRPQIRNLLRNERVLLSWQKNNKNQKYSDLKKPMEYMKSGQYRLSVRAFMLDALLHLHHSGLIRLDANKTNMDYFYELESAAIKQDFSALSDVYSRVWYGGNEPDREMAENVKQIWLKLKKKTGAHENA